MVFVTNPFILPLLILISSVDAWLWLAAIRWLLAKFSPHSRSYSIITQLTDPLPRYIHSKVSHVYDRLVSQLAMWPITIIAALIIRHILVLSVASIQQLASGQP